MAGETPHTPQPIDFLDEDIITVPGQVYALVSVVSPTNRQKGEQCALKIRGVFGMRDEAERHVKKLMRVDSAFDVYVVELYKWVPFPPDPNQIEDQRYVDDYLNKLMQGYKESQLAAKQEFAERKRELQEKGLEAVLTEEERIPKPDSVPDIFSAPDLGPAGR